MIDIAFYFPYNYKTELLSLETTDTLLKITTVLDS